MPAAKILVVRNVNMTLEQFGDMGIDVQGVAPTEIEFVHAEVELGELPEDIHERVMRMVEEHQPVLIFVVEDARAVSDWLEDMKVGDVLDLEVPINTSEGLVLGYYGIRESGEGSDDEETDD